MSAYRFLVLEDDPERIKSFKERFSEINQDHPNIADFVETAKNCIDKLQENEYDIVFLDHDLGGEVFVSISNENTGSAVARWIKENGEKIPVKTSFIIHSFNPTGAENMEKLITGSVRIPSVWVKEIFSVIQFK